MLAGQLILSLIVAIAVTSTSLLLGNGVLFSFLLYMFSGSLTLLLLAVWALVRADI